MSKALRIAAAVRALGFGEVRQARTESTGYAPADLRVIREGDIVIFNDGTVFLEENVAEDGANALNGVVRPRHADAGPIGRSDAAVGQDHRLLQDGVGPIDVLEPVRGGLGEPVQGEVARGDLVPRAGDADLRLREVLVPHADRTEHAAGGGPLEPVGDVAAAGLDVRLVLGRGALGHGQRLRRGVRGKPRCLTILPDPVGASAV